MTTILYHLCEIRKQGEVYGHALDQYLAQLLADNLVAKNSDFCLVEIYPAAIYFYEMPNTPKSIGRVQSSCPKLGIKLS